MNTDATSAESSPAPEPIVTPSLDRLTDVERQTWRKTGSLPDASAVSSPATPDQATSTDVSITPASEPGSPAKPPKKNAESRIQELLADRARLTAELAAAKAPAQPQTPAASSPAPVPVEQDFPDYDAWMTTQPENRQTYERYIDARATHVYRQEQAADRQRQADEAAQREHAGIVTTFQQRADAFVADHADYGATIAPVVTANLLLPMRDALEDVIARSENGPRLLYHLGSHLEEFQRLTALPPAQAAYELGKLESIFGQPAPPVAKHLSSAPPPPPTLGSKPASPVDDLEAAIKRGDFATYKLAANKRAIGR